MTRPLSVGVAGLGTVGGGVLKMLRDNADIVAARAGRPIAVTAVSARDRSRDRGFPVSGLHWYEDSVALAADPGVDVVVELIGGSEGPARALAEAAIAAGTRTPVIIWRHIIPNTFAALMVQATFICASAMITEAILSFIGAGTPPTVPSWGNIMAEGRALWQIKPFIVFFPAVFLSVTVLAVNLVGDGLRDALDPRLAKRL